MTLLDLSSPVSFALAAAAIAFVTAFLVGTLVFGDPGGEAASRGATITVGVAIATFLVRRVTTTRQT